jgi:hypothetical protein
MEHENSQQYLLIKKCLYCKIEGSLSLAPEWFEAKQTNDRIRLPGEVRHKNKASFFMALDVHNKQHFFNAEELTLFGENS